MGYNDSNRTDPAPLSMPSVGQAPKETPRRVAHARTRQQTAGVIRNLDDNFTIDLFEQLLTVSDGTNDRVLLGQVAAGLYGIRVLDSTGAFVLRADSGLADGAITIAAHAGIGGTAGPTTGVALKVGDTIIGNGNRMVSVEGELEASANSEQNNVGVFVQTDYDAAGFTGLRFDQVFVGGDLQGASGTVASWRQITIDEPSDLVGASITELVGLHINDIDNATGSNFAIRTNAGLVDFGDRVTAAAQPRARAFISSPQTIGTGSWTQIDFGAESFDVGLSHVSGVFTARGAGIYLVLAQVEWENGTTGSRQLRVVQDPGGSDTVLALTQITPGVTTLQGQSIMTLWNAADGVTLEIQAFQDSGGDLDLSAGTSLTYASIIKLW